MLRYVHIQYCTVVKTYKYSTSSAVVYEYEYKYGIRMKYCMHYGYL
jgi:hypothetical protein